MPNDAKLGMVLGVALVIAVAVFFVHKVDPTAPTQAASTAPGDRPHQQPSEDEKRSGVEEKKSEDAAIPPADPGKPPENDQNP